MKLQQFLALSVGTEIRAFRGQKFIVEKRVVLDGIEQPHLVDTDTQEPLFGAIYIAHLLGFEGSTASTADVDDSAVIANPAQSPTLESVADDETISVAVPHHEDDAEVYAETSPSFAGQDASLFDLTNKMIAEQPTSEQYQLMLEAQ